MVSAIVTQGVAALAFICCCSAFNFEELLRSKFVKSEVLKRGGSSACNQYVKYEKMLSSSGEALKKVSEGMSGTQCRQACTEETDFHCTAALMRHPGSCFVTGYRLRHDFWSKHYQRTCDSGARCFKLMSGWTGGFRNSVSIPPVQRTSNDAKVAFCRHVCEQAKECVGFEIKANRNVCLFSDFAIQPNQFFDLHLRRC